MSDSAWITFFTSFAGSGIATTLVDRIFSWLDKRTLRRNRSLDSTLVCLDRCKVLSTLYWGSLTPHIATSSQTFERDLEDIVGELAGLSGNLSGCCMSAYNEISADLANLLKILPNDTAAPSPSRERDREIKRLIESLRLTLVSYAK